MPPKKKTAFQPATGSTTSSGATFNAAAASTSAAVGDASMDLSMNEGDISTNQVGAGIDQFELPKSVVMKLAKEEIPSNFVIRKDTTTALVKSSSVFINYLTAAAHEVAQRHGKKTIMASHVMEAIGELEFPPEMFEEIMQEHLEAYRANQGEKKQSKNASKKDSAEQPSKEDRNGTGASTDDEEMADRDEGDDADQTEDRDHNDEDMND